MARPGCWSAARSIVFWETRRSARFRHREASKTTSAAKNESGASVIELFGELEPTRKEYQDRDARLAVMDEQGLDGAFFFPTLAVGMEQALKNDLPAGAAAFRAFNRWLEEDWGFHYQERIFSAPYISLSDPANAVRELEWPSPRAPG